MRRIKQLKCIITMLVLLSAITVAAGTGNATIDSANAAYAGSDYEKAAKLYEEVLASGLEAPEVYYNLGNAYYKLNRVGLSILNYERAKKLAPNDEDIKHNLALANQRITDKIEPVPQLFIEEWKSGFVNLFSATGWAMTCIVMFIFLLTMLGLYITGNTKGKRQLGFWAGLAFLVFSTSSFFIARKQHNLMIEAQDAIVTSSSVTVKGSPSEKGTKLFVIHEGTKVEIEEIDGTWVEVKIANGNVGWVQASSITFI
jgi:hypothetical protein